MNKYVLTIIISVYNGERFIKPLILNLSTVLNASIQIVIVNDGSTDNSYEVIDACTSSIPNTILYTQKNKGLSEARNAGINLAEGKYILFMDVDDFLIKEGVITLLSYIKDSSSDIIMGKYIRSNNKKEDIHYQFPSNLLIDDVRLYIYNRIPDSIWNVWRYVFRRQFIIDNNLTFHPGIYCEDVDWTPKALNAASSIHFFNEPFYVYVDRPGSIMNTVSPQRTLDLLNTISINMKLYEKCNYRNALYSRMAWEAFCSISDYIVYNKTDKMKIRQLLKEIQSCFQHANQFPVRIYYRLRKVIPTCLWSLGLFIVKKAKRFLIRQ